MRVSRPEFHSTADFVCPISPAQEQSSHASANTTGQNATGLDSLETCSDPNAGAGSCYSATVLEVGLMQSKLNKVLAVDTAKHTMRAGAGITFGELLKAATNNGLSVQVRRVRQNSRCVPYVNVSSPLSA